MHNEFEIPEGGIFEQIVLYYVFDDDEIDNESISDGVTDGDLDTSITDDSMAEQDNSSVNSQISDLGTPMHTEDVLDSDIFDEDSRGLENIPDMPHDDYIMNEKCINIECDDFNVGTDNTNSTPPDIKMDVLITDICFHPKRNVIALATISGDIAVYKYTHESNTLLNTIELHAKSCRDVEFSIDGYDLLSCSKDKSIMVTDMQTEKLKIYYESAHDDPINKMYVIDENLFSTGDDNGTVKLWDMRSKDAVFSLTEVQGYITQILTNNAKKLLLACSSDGYLTTIDIGSQNLHAQSKINEEKCTCMGLYDSDSKLIVGTSKGHLYTYGWGNFGNHCDMYPCIESSIDEMIPISNYIACIAEEQNTIQAFHISPFRLLGVIGHHTTRISSLDVNPTGTMVASSSYDNDVQFWRVQHFE